MNGRMNVLVAFVWVLASAHVWAGDAELVVPKDGLEISGTVKASDAKVTILSADGKSKVAALPSKGFVVKLVGKQDYQIDMIAENQQQLDPFLVVQDDRGQQLEFDDDSGGGQNARLVFRSPKDGTFLILAAAFTGEGKFTLRIHPSKPGVAEIQRATQLANNLNAQGKYAQAQPIYQKALDMCLALLSEKHPDTAKCYNNLAMSLHAQTKYAEAQPLYQKALDLRLELFGEKHSDTAQSYSNVASNLDKQGKHAQALPLFQKALDICREGYGEKHPATAFMCNNLATNLDAQGKYAQAQPLFQKALAIRLAVFGEKHPETALSYNNLASNLDKQGKHAQALPLFQKALEIIRDVQGEKHPHTAMSYNNVAVNLNAQGKHEQALPLHQKALAIRLELLGEKHPETAQSYNNVAAILEAQGQHAQALPLYQKAFAIYLALLGEKHPDTAQCYSNMAGSLNALDQFAQAQPLLQKALDIRREVLGEKHPHTATSYNNMAMNLGAQGKHALAQPLHQKAFETRLELLGEKHPDTARSFYDVASSLDAQGKYVQAQPLYQKALEIFREVQGEKHPDTATMYQGVASNLDAQRKYVHSQPLLQKVLDISLELFGEKHPDTAQSYNNMALNLDHQGKYEQAQPLYQKALEIIREVQGEKHNSTAVIYNNVASNLDAQGQHAQARPFRQKSLDLRLELLGQKHPHTAGSYNRVAYNLYAQKNYAEAEKALRAGLLAYDTARIDRATSGFARALGAKTSPRPLLAAVLAQRGALEDAWDQAEANLARGLLDDLDAPAKQLDHEVKSRLALLSKLDEGLVPLLTTQKMEPGQKKVRADLLRQRTELLDELSDRAAKQAAARVLPFMQVQQQLAADAAMLFWMDTEIDVWACVVVREGLPRWHRLPGSGEDGAWTKVDRELHRRLYDLLADAKPDTEVERTRLSRVFLAQYFEPLRAHLKDVRRLLVVPTGPLAWVPLEALIADYTISYVPSGSVYARLAQKHRPLQGSSLLALGDPIFAAPSGKPAMPPGHGLLVQLVVPGGNAHKAGVQAGDVLLRYDDTPLKQLTDLRPTQGKFQVNALLWRDGEEIKIRLDPGTLGVSIDKRPVSDAVTAWREHKSMLASLHRSGHQRLPASRFEVETLARLVGMKESVVLTGSDASEQALDQLGKEGLKRFRLLHFATHGDADLLTPQRSRLILAQDKLPSEADKLEAVRKQAKVYTGEVTVQAIQQEWQLDADLVVLSACQTALGKPAEGDGHLGFAQAFLQKGARSVVLSRWKVEDTATALLMLRFYENALGKRRELKAPLGRAEALAEARQWLRNLSRSDAERLAGGLASGEVRGSERPELLPAKSAKGPTLPAGDRPFVHPFYWASFILVGDPN